MNGLRHAREGAAFSTGEPYVAVEIAGPDATAFLQSQLPVDVSALPPGSGAFTARLDAKGRVRFLCTLLATGDGFLALVERGLQGAFGDDLGTFLIREKVALRDVSSDVAVLELHGPAVPEVLTALGAPRFSLEPYRHAAWAAAWGTTRFVAHPWTGELGGHLVLPRSALGEATRRLTEAGAAALDGSELEVLRVEGGLPVAADLGERTLLPELDRDAEMVSYDKGCFLGQETVARVHSRGQVTRLWRGLLIEGDAPPPAGSVVSAGGEPVGETASAAVSPDLGTIALARVRRHHAGAGTVVHVEFGGRHVAARVSELPLYRRPGPAEEAEKLYREGLDAYREDRFEEARARFERAVLLNPNHFAAYEAMGVSLERLGRLDEAVEAMRELAEMDPGNPMAWTNLSRYHAQQGRIEDAEAAKGKALALAWKQKAGEAAARKQAEEDLAARARRLEERVGLFRQVLELDADDVVANFGLGKVLYDLERYSEAAGCFAKAVAAQPDYSMAYNLWGTSLLRTGRGPEAAEVFRRGIEAATRKGDLMPKQDMERKLQEALG